MGSIPLADEPTDITINQNTKLAYVTEYNGTMQVLNLNTNQVVTTIQGDFHGKAAVNPTTNYVYVADSDGQHLDVINAATNTVVAQIPTLGAPYSVAVNPVTNKIYVSETDQNGAGYVQVIDGATNQVIKTIPGFDQAYRIAVNPNTNKVYVTSENPNYVNSANASLLTTIDGASDTISNQQQFQGYIYEGDIAVDTVNNQVTVASSYSSGNTFLFDGNGNLVRRINNGSYYNDVYGAAVNPETGNTYEASQSTGLSIFNPDGNEMQVIPAPCAAAVDVTNL
ncbi:MAG: YncE family protein [Oscillospiraceae bacterium]|nr:YncE family protein [Oscillospiraceae bacterium]